MRTRLPGPDPGSHLPACSETAGSERPGRAGGPARRALAFVAAFAVVACGDDGMGPTPEGPTIELAVQRLAPLDPAVEGVYEVWVVDRDGLILSAGRIEAPTPGEVLTVTSPVEAPAYLMVTVEPPGDEDGAPSLMKLLGGRFDASGATELGVTGYLTPVGMPLEEAPGVHVLGVHSGGDGGAGGAPADAGLWLADTRVDSTDASFFQTFTPLTQGWTYEGWVVRDYGTPGEVWMSYGQFLPNNLRKARFRDDTGLGPFSGFADYERALPTDVHYPGDDWVSNPLELPVPGGVSLPLDLNGDAAGGVPSRWTHVITIEPRYEPDGIRSEAPWEAEPFFLRPYGNPIGEAPAHAPRTIGFFPGGLPEGRATIGGGGT